jgi:predicted DNA-binding protein (MmcQ/YjbR family)
MTADDFRRLALELSGAVESAHMNHPDFRVNGEIFATSQYPNAEWAMVKLSPEQQADFVQSYEKAFRPVKGAWGRQGCTNVLLSEAEEDAVRAALQSAWRHATESRPAAKRKR